MADVADVEYGAAKAEHLSAFSKELDDIVAGLESHEKGPLVIELYSRAQEDVDLLTESIPTRLCPALKATTRNILSLEMYGQGALTTTAFRSLFQAMGENKGRCCNPMEILSLCDFNLKLDETVTLSTLLPHFTSLKQLRLESNNLGDYGCTALCENLGSLTQLKVLQLCDNKIGNAGLLSLTSVLPQLKSTEALYVLANDFDKATAGQFLLAAAGHSQLQTLDLGYWPSDFGIPSDKGGLAKYLPLVRLHPLHFASGVGNVEQVQKLIQSKAVDVDATDEEFGEPAIFYAARRGNNDIIRILVQEGGASLRIKKKKGESVVDVAVDIPARFGRPAVDLSSTRALLEDMIFMGADDTAK